jgi:glycosyltransferase involved in cell wall biosynthesis
MLTSVIIRTYNEERYLDELLSMLERQRLTHFKLEIVIVDSGSTDQTLAIAQSHDCHITSIKKEEFTFGRSLNIGCEYANGELLVFISGHCIPVDEYWLENLCKPMVNSNIGYVYGRQVGKDTTKFSESRHFEKWFPDYSKLPQEGFFCNNANAAITRHCWENNLFNEELTGLEDMYLAKQLVKQGNKIGYVSEAAVYHIHDESWRQVCLRYEREALALHQIMPDIHISFIDFIRFFITGVVTDVIYAIKEKQMTSKFTEILLFRFYHYWGSYKGNHVTRKLSAERREQYFYPQNIELKKTHTANQQVNKITVKKT